MSCLTQKCPRPAVATDPFGLCAQCGAARASRAAARNAADAVESARLRASIASLNAPRPCRFCGELTTYTDHPACRSYQLVVNAHWHEGEPDIREIRAGLAALNAPATVVANVNRWIATALAAD